MSAFNPRRFSAEQFALGGATILLFAPLVLAFVTGRTIPMTDMRGFHVPTRWLYQQALRSGESILWTPAIYSGAYLHGEGQVGEFHPVHWLMYRFLPLFSAVSLELLLNYIVAFAGSVIFFRRLLRLAWTSAWVGALFFTFSGFMLLHAAHLNMVAVLAHAPWVWWLTDIILVDERRRRELAAVALGAVTASQWLLGFPQAMYFTMLGAVCLAGIRTASARRLTPLGWWGGALALGTALGAVQILPTLDMAAHSYRARSGPDFAVIYSLHPANVIQLIAPYTWPSRVYTVDEPPIPHEFGLYNGVFCTLALVWLAIRFRSFDRNRRHLVMTIAGFGLVFLILAFGRFGGLQPLIVEVTGLSLFRAPTRQIFLVHFALAGLAALTFDDLAGCRRVNRAGGGSLWILWVPLALALVSVGLINRSGSSLPSVNGAAPLSTAAVSIACMAAVTFLLFGAGRGWRWALPLLLVTASADLGWWGYSFAMGERPLRPESLLAQALVPPDGKPGDYIWRPEQMLDGDLPVMHGFRMADGYLALSPKTLMDPSSATALRIHGVRWAWLSEQWNPVGNPMARVRLVTETTVVRLRSLRVMLDKIDVSRTATVEREIGALQGAPGSAALVEDRPGKIVVASKASGRQLLVITERFHEGWQALEGCEGSPFPVYGELTGCVVSSGDHRIVMQFEPRSFIVGSRVSAGALIAWVLGAGLIVVRRQRQAV